MTQHERRLRPSCSVHPADAALRAKWPVRELSPHEYASLCGPSSAIRRWARYRGLEDRLPEPPKGREAEYEQAIIEYEAQRLLALLPKRGRKAK